MNMPQQNTELLPDDQALTLFIQHQMGDEFPQTLTVTDFRQQIADRISWLLDHNLPMLMSLLYRIDVHEVHVKRVMMLSPPQTLALDLTDLILEKLRQKLYYRRKYAAETHVEDETG